MRRRPSRTLPDPRLLLLLTGLACSQIGADCEMDDDDSSAEQFCVTVAGGGGFDTIQEAIDAAPAGGVITVCAGLPSSRTAIFMRMGPSSGPIGASTVRLSGSRRPRAMAR